MPKPKFTNIEVVNAARAVDAVVEVLYENDATRETWLALPGEDASALLYTMMRKVLAADCVKKS